MLGVAAYRTVGGIAGAAFELVAPVGHLDGFGTSFGQQRVLAYVAVADIVEVVGEELTEPDLIGEGYSVGYPKFYAAAKGDGKLCKGVFLTAGILREPLPFRAQGAQIDLASCSVVGIWVEMKDCDAGEHIGCQLVFPRIEEIVFPEQVPLPDGRLEAKVPGPQVGFRCIAVRRRYSGVRKIGENGEMTGQIVLETGAKRGVSLLGGEWAFLQVTEIVGEASIQIYIPLGLGKQR